MDIIDTPQPIEAPKGPIAPKVQPVAALANLDPMLDDATVRQALVQAEANNVDPTTLTLEDMVKGQSKEPVAPPEPVTPAPQVPVLQPDVTTPEVPQKFLKPDGEVDVEKLVASSRQLDEAIQKKETALQKTVDDYVREYREKETKLRTLPNPEKLAAQMPPTPAAPAVNPATMSQQEIEAILMRDFQANPVATMANLVDAALKARLAPFEEKEKDDRIRTNIADIASKDPRVLRDDVFSAINRKLSESPELWNLKNPHKAAYLEVKEELRLGDLPQGGQAQPSRPPAPVLAGGTPPSTPSVPATQSRDVLGNLDKIDLRDRRQEAMGDEAVRAFLARNNR